MAVKQNSKNSQKKGVKSLIGGTILTDDRVAKQIPFIFLLAFLGIVLITNRNVAEKTIRKIEILQDSVKELRSESVTISAKLMDVSRRSEVVNRVKEANIGLQELNTPIELKVDKD